MKRQTKAQKCNDLANAVKQINSGEKVRRIGARDGSIPTHPVVACPNLPELGKDGVQDLCYKWLKKHHVFCSRHDAGSFQNERGQWGTYGIKGSGDIHGMLKNNWGKHFEIECKRGSGGRQSKKQQDRMKDVRENNGLYFVVHGVEELEYFMGEWV
jgi:hypothetical protein